MQIVIAVWILSYKIKEYIFYSNCNGKPLEGLKWDLIYLILKLSCSKPTQKKDLLERISQKNSHDMQSRGSKRGVDESQQRRRKWQTIKLNQYRDQDVVP